MNWASGTLSKIDANSAILRSQDVSRSAPEAGVQTDYRCGSRDETDRYLTLELMAQGSA